MKLNIMVAGNGRKRKVKIATLMKWKPFSGLTASLEREHKQAYASLLKRKTKEINKNIYMSLN